MSEKACDPHLTSGIRHLLFMFYLRDTHFRPLDSRANLFAD
jgi:hypothetical protein